MSKSTIPTIHCHTQADKNTVAYTKFMWETMTELASRPDALHLTVHCMDHAAGTKVNELLNNVHVVVVSNGKNSGLSGSAGHAACIMNALAMTGDGEIHIIVDSDTVMVAKGWDDYIRIRMMDDNVGMIGSAYEDIGEFSSGTGTLQTYKKIPTFTWGALSPHHSWKNLDVTPNKSRQINISTPLLSSIYNLPVGYNVFGEAAWQVPQYLHDNNLTYDGWYQHKPTKSAVVLKGLSDYHEEWHVENIPFVVHHRGSMRHTYRVDKISKQFYEAVDAKLASETSQAPRWTWS